MKGTIDTKGAYLEEEAIIGSDVLQLVQDGHGSSSETDDSWWEVRLNGELVGIQYSTYFFAIRKFDYEKRKLERRIK